MATIASGNTAEIYCPLATDVAFTPGSGGSMRVAVAVRSGAAAISSRLIQSATTISISAGATVFAEAIGADATYTDPALTAAEVVSLRSIAAGAGTIAASRAALAADNTGYFALNSGVTWTISDASLIPAGVTMHAPAAGGGTIAVGGSVTINGATSSTTLTGRQVAVLLPTPGSSTDLTLKVS